MTGPTGDRVVAGRYRPAEMLGRGGMGTVWRAYDTVLDRVVAMKEVRVPDDLDDEERARRSARAMREVRAAALVAHPNVVGVYDVVVEDDGRPWIIMELVVGRTLADDLDEGRLPVRDAARITRQLLEALRAVHAASVVHRDVKPGNVLLSHDGRAVLTDFGIATLVGTTTITATGTTIGTLEYMAPERAQGLRPGPASDLWSLGATLYEMLEGRSPFRRNGEFATLQAVLDGTYDPPRHAGPLVGVLAGLLESDPDRRVTADAALRLLADAGFGGPDGCLGSADGRGGGGTTEASAASSPAVVAAAAAVSAAAEEDAADPADGGKAGDAVGGAGDEAAHRAAGAGAGAGEASGEVSEETAADVVPLGAAGIPPEQAVTESAAEQFQWYAPGHGAADDGERPGVRVSGPPPKPAAPPVAGLQADGQAAAHASVYAPTAAQPGPWAGVGPGIQPGPQPESRPGIHPWARAGTVPGPHAPHAPHQSEAAPASPNAPRPRTRRTRFLVSALALLLVAAGAGTTLWLLDDDGRGPDRGGSAAAQGESGGADGGDADGRDGSVPRAGGGPGTADLVDPNAPAPNGSSPSQSTSGPPSATPPTSAPPTSAASAAPPGGTGAVTRTGYHRVADPGFTVLVPDGWTGPHKDGDRVFYRSPGNVVRLGLRPDPADTSGDPCADLAAQDAGGTGSSATAAYPGYRRVQLAATSHNGTPGCLWEFTWNDAGTPRRSVNLRYTDGIRMYDFWVSGPVAGTATVRDVFDAAKSSFTPTS